MSQSVDDMSQNKIVTNRTSSKKLTNHPYILVHIVPFGVTYRLGQMRLVTNRQSLMSQVTDVPISGRHVSKRERYALFKQT